MKNVKNANNNTTTQNNLLHILPLVFCIIAAVTFLLLPVTNVNLGMGNKIKNLSALGLFINSGSIFASEGYVGNDGGIVFAALLVITALLLIGIILTIVGCVTKKKKLYTSGMSLSMIAFAALFINLIVFPYIVPNAFGKKAYLFTEIGRAWNSLHVGYWIPFVSLLVSGVLVAKRDEK